MEKGTRFGKEVQEAVWQSAQVDALYRLACLAYAFRGRSTFSRACC